MKMTETEEPDFIFVQETFEYQNRPVGIVKKYRIFTARNGKHRAPIVILNNNMTPYLSRRYLMKTQYF